jgi:hypothetical protein
VREDRVLKKIFGHKREEVTGDWTTLCSEELYDLCCCPNVSRVTKSRRMRWAGHVASIGERRGSCRVLVGDLNERDHLEDLGVEWVFRKYGGEGV